jgi:hypothetical protein
MEQQEMALSWATGPVWKSVCFTPLNIIPPERFSRNRLKGFLSQRSLEGRVRISSTSTGSSLSLSGSQGMPVRPRSFGNVFRWERGYPHPQEKWAFGSILLWLTWSREKGLWSRTSLGSIRFLKGMGLILQRSRFSSIQHSTIRMAVWDLMKKGRRRSLDSLRLEK